VVCPACPPSPVTSGYLLRPYSPTGRGRGDPFLAFFLHSVRCCRLGEMPMVRLALVGSRLSWPEANPIDRRRPRPPTSISATRAPRLPPRPPSLASPGMPVHVARHQPTQIMILSKQHCCPHLRPSNPSLSLRHSAAPSLTMSAHRLLSSCLQQLRQRSAREVAPVPQPLLLPWLADLCLGQRRSAPNRRTRNVGTLLARGRQFS